VRFHADSELTDNVDGVKLVKSENERVLEQEVLKFHIKDK